MSNSTTNLDLISSSQSNKEITANALFDASSPSSAYGRRASTSNLLTWGYYGANVLLNNTLFTIANGVLTLAPSTTNFIEANLNSGVVSVNQTGFATIGSIRLYSVVTSSTAVSSYTDFRSQIMLDNNVRQIKFKDVKIGDPVKNGNGDASIITTAISTGTSPKLTSADPTGRFIYVSNSTANTVSQYSINQNTGALTSIATALATGTTPQYIAIDPTGRFLYIANSGANTVSQYSINQTTGALTSITTAIATGGSTPISCFCDVTGRFLFVANSATGNIVTYSINQNTGALTNIFTSAVFGVINFMCLNPNGKYLHCQINNGNSIQTVTINQGNGSLTQSGGSAGAGGTGLTGITTDASGRYLYALTTSTNKVNIFVLNAIGDPVTGPTAVTLGTTPTHITSDLSGYYLYATNSGSNNITVLSINQATGALTVVNTITVGTAPNGITIDGTSRFVYVANNTDNTLSQLVTHNFYAGAAGFSGLLSANKGLSVSSGLINLPQFTTANAPTFVVGGCYFDTTLNKIRIGGAAGWETVMST